ncbi:MAG: endo-1,4-beta-xylanase [Treponema sp.]|nr:endo-1,4-beta-xylanase [Treponema sp.]
MVKKAALAVGISAALISTILGFFPKNEGKIKAQNREVTQNILNDYNVNFEGVSDTGSLWWWNDNSWSPNCIPRVAYESGEQPGPDCGGSYVKVISQNGNSAQCQICAGPIAQLIEGGATYSYTCYMKTADDSAVPTGKVYLVVNGAASDWSKVDSATVTPDQDYTLNDKWQLITGSFVLADPHDQVQFQFNGSEGLSYCIDDFRVGLETPAVTSIEKDIVSLKDAVTSSKGFGRKVWIGGAVTGAEASDSLYMDLLFKHFNSVTLGNELKMDAMNGYHEGNRSPIGITTDTLNGKEIKVPVLDHSRADALLDKIAAWNKENPKDAIKVRGHVLVWHSQAPEWFFHEDYNAANPYVTKDVMNERLEWYIKTMLTYYTDQSTATGKKYGPLFYGWDVVNEAISDATGTYRTDTEGGADQLSDSTHGSKSSWWHVYQSNEFIINAFKFANKYAPASLELYYNDYNECTPSKVEGIVQLLRDVKNAEGTRISGMGMQGHYDLNGPTIAQIESAVRAYCAEVGSVMITEFDMKASSSFDPKNPEEEYNKQAYRYKAIYDKLVQLDKEPGIEVKGIVFWGVLDPYSWLQSSNNVGGASDGTQTQCPLLFDGKYKAKPAFYAFADPDKLEPAIQNVTIIEGDGEDFSNAIEYVIPVGNSTVSFYPLWSDGQVFILVWPDDDIAGGIVSVFIDDGNGITPVSLFASESQVITIDTPAAKVSGNMKIDFRYKKDNEVYSFNDLKNTQDSSSKFYAKAMLKPFASVKKGSPSLSFDDPEWNKADPVDLTIRLGAKADSSMRLLWDEKALYVYASVKDSVINTDSADDYQQDSIEVFIDENNAKAESYEADDKQYRVSCRNKTSFNGEKCLASNMESIARLTDDGYEVVAAFKWTDITPEVWQSIGLELQINDADNSGSRIGTLSWYDENGTGYMNPSVFGTVLLDE